MNEITITRVLPRAALPGGEVAIECKGLELAGTARPEVRFGDNPAQVMIASNRQILARVPESAAEQGTSHLSISSNGQKSRPFSYEIGKRLATNLHPVANPAVDADGSVYATYSGRRGQKTPVSIYKVSPEGAVTPFVTEIVNATGLAFDMAGQLFVSSRAEGIIYRIDATGNFENYIEGMGIATGIAFDREDNLYVGDRSGSIFKIDRKREVFVFATIEPSICAYHLAFGLDDYLYVAGPTTSSFDSIYRVSPTGEVDRFFTGLGRPQGLAFDIDGNLYAATSYRGRRGIFKFREGAPELFVAGLNLVGLCFDFEENMVVADGNSIYRLEIGVMGKPLP